MNGQTGMRLTFPVESFRRIPNPYRKAEEGERDATMYVAVCDVTALPDNIPMETNPRKQKLTTGVAKKIKASLLDTTQLDFYLLNRGLLLSAKDVAYDNNSNELTVVFEDQDVHGNVDGGHTYRTILENRDQLETGQQYVKLEILTGVENIFQNLAAARNMSVQVQDKSIAELEKRFEIIKDVIQHEPFQERVYFKENDEGDIDVADILAVLNMFNLSRYPDINSQPTVSFSGKKKCIDNYIEDHKKYGDGPSNPYVKMQPVMPALFKLHDEIECNMNRYYQQKNPNGRYGSVKGVLTAIKDKDKDKDKRFTTKYYQQEMEHQSPTGFLYPILGAFRTVLEEKNGVYCWRKDPFQVLEDVGGNLVNTTVERSRSLGNNPQSTGKDSGHWTTLYMFAGFQM